MHVLVAGGAGFVGSHLVDELLAEGHDVDVVDSFVTGSRENLAHVSSVRLRLIRRDVARTESADYERIYHLASPASPDAYGRLPIQTLLTNSAGTDRLLRIAAVSGARFLLASTSEVYGDPLVHPQVESYWGNVNPIGPRSQYDEGKRFAEALTVAYVRERHVDARIVRIFNSYGPRMAVNDGRMPTAFITTAIAGAPIPVHGDGTQTRSLCYVADTVRGLIAAMEQGRIGEVYNIGRSDEISVRAFAELVQRTAGSASPIVLVPGRQEDIHRRCPDTSKAERELGWTPQTTLEEGLRETITWYRARSLATHTEVLARKGITT